MIASNDTLSNPSNFTPPMQTSLFVRCTLQNRGGMLTAWKLPNFCRSAVAPMLLCPEF